MKIGAMSSPNTPEQLAQPIENLVDALIEEGRQAAARRGPSLQSSRPPARRGREKLTARRCVCPNQGAVCCRASCGSLAPGEIPRCGRTALRALSRWFASFGNASGTSTFTLPTLHEALCGPHRSAHARMRSPPKRPLRGPGAIFGASGFRVAGEQWSWQPWHCRLAVGCRTATSTLSCSG